MSYSSDGKYLLIEYGQGNGIQEEGETLKQIALWDAETGREIWTVRDPDLAERAYWLPGTHHILFYDWNGQISIWDADQGRPRPDVKPLHAFGEPAEEDCPVALSGDGRRVMTVGKLGTRVWDVTTGKVICYLNSEHGRVLGMGSSQLSPNGKLALTRFAAYPDSEDSALWDVNEGTILRVWKRETKWSPRWFFPDGKRLLGEERYGGEAGACFLEPWDMISDKLEGWKVKGGKTRVFTPDGKALLIMMGKGLARVDTRTGKVATLWEAPVIHSPRGLGGAVAFSPDRTRLVVERGGCKVEQPWTIRVELWDATTGKFLRELAEVKTPD